MFRFSESSSQRLATTQDIVQQIVKRALEISHVDFGIPKFGGKRTAQQQKQLFDEGKSQCDGYTNKSYHQTGMAIDFYAFVSGKATWEPVYLAMVAAAMLQAATEFGVQAEWGGLWSSKDGSMYGWDCGHIQFKL